VNGSDIHRLLELVRKLHQGGGGLSGGSRSRSVNVQNKEIAKATAMMLPPANPMNTKYGIPKT